MGNSISVFDKVRVFIPLLSIVIPCYNEAENLPILIKKCLKLVETNLIEVILVDNGSTDNTPVILTENLINSARLYSIRVEINQGYGFGIVSGLRVAQGRYLGWMHADLQTDPLDVLPALDLILSNKERNDVFLKGERYGRGCFDVIFTLGMTLFELIMLKQWLRDINGQPNIFSRDFFDQLENPPNDFSLDLYVFHMATLKGLQVIRYPVRFNKRVYGFGNNDSLLAKLRFSYRVINYSVSLRKRYQN